ncbi:hypothetical protein [Spirillospora sp. CA-294931]|uniref:hypothetical protein n=1 Tax=Spirillospora sp. CA-294931 TaxID=3240042 RepID=UPI003D933CB9
MSEVTMEAAAPAAPASTPAPSGYGLGIGPDGTYTPAAQVVAFICGLWTMVLFFPFLILGALLYTNAEPAFESDPRRARKMMLWSWLSVSLLPLLAAAIVGGVVFAINA